MTAFSPSVALSTTLLLCVFGADPPGGTAVILGWLAGEAPGMPRSLLASRQRESPIHRLSKATTSNGCTFVIVTIFPSWICTA